MMRRTGQGDGRFSALAMRLAHASGATALASRLQGGYGCLLTFHRVAPSDIWAGLPNRDFHIDADFLSKLLDYLRRTGWAVVTNSSTIARKIAALRSSIIATSIPGEPTSGSLLRDLALNATECQQPSSAGPRRR